MIYAMAEMKLASPFSVAGCVTAVLLSLLPLSIAAAQSADRDTGPYVRAANSSELWLAPTDRGDTGLWQVPSAYVLHSGRMGFSLFRDDFDFKARDVDAAIHGFTAAYGITSSLEGFGSVAFSTRVDTDKIPNIQQSIPPLSDFPFAGTGAISPGWQTGFGDIRLGAKYKIRDDFGGQRTAIALRTIFKIPSADSSKGLGTGTFSWSLDGVASKNLGLQTDLHAMFGLQYSVKPKSADVSNLVRWGIGSNFPMPLPCCRTVQLVAEASGEAHFDSREEHPVTLAAGPVIWFKSGFFVRPLVAFGIAAHEVSFQISLGFHPTVPAKSAAAPVAPAPMPAPLTRLSAPTTVASGSTAVISFQLTNPYHSEITWDASLSEDPAAGGTLTPASGGPIAWVPGFTLTPVQLSYNTGTITKARIKVTVHDARGVIDRRVVSIQVQ